MEGTALQGGLEFLHNIIILWGTIKPFDMELLVSAMQSKIVSSYIPINGLDGCFGIVNADRQEERRRQTPSRRDELMAECAPLPFQGDDWCCPPLAWTVSCSGTYSNLIGTYFSDRPREWGYVFWDAGRLKRLGSRDILEMHLETWWHEFLMGKPEGYARTGRKSMVAGQHSESSNSLQQY